MSMILETARIASLPNTAYYIPDFITAEEEERLIQKVWVFQGYLLPFTDTNLHDIMLLIMAHIVILYPCRQYTFFLLDIVLTVKIDKFGSPSSLDSALPPAASNMAISAHRV